ncbi:MAG: phenylacetate--CoA ligase [Spirochaetota bacterium]
MIFNKAIETMPRQKLAQLQLERLQATLHRIYKNVAFYKQSFDTAGIDIEDIVSLEHLADLPFTTKDDLRKSYPYDLFAVPLKDIVRIHSSSGTTGKPIVVGYTKNDLANWAESTARFLVSAGVTDHDFMQIAFDYGLFTGGFGFHYAAEQVGASVIPASSGGSVQKQITIMKDYRTTVLASTPGYAMRIAKGLEEMHLHPSSLNLKVGIFGAEPWSEHVREELETKLRIRAYDTYGLSEIMGPGVSGECSERNGLHVNEDQVIVEVIDPVTLTPAAVGDEGELVFTNIAKEGCPLIRYRTGDIARLLPGDCPCGRTHMRMSRVARRTDDIVVFMGLKISPAQVESILANAEGVEPEFRIVLGNALGPETMEIKVAISEGIAVDEIKVLEDLKTTITRQLALELGLTAKVTLVERASIEPRDGGKGRIEDNRR